MLLKRKRVLVVDDQVSLTRVISAVAAGMGLDVRVVNNPNDALDVFLDYRPDILILDIVMPEKDGVDVLHEVMLTGVDTRVILISGFTEAYAQLAAGVAAFHGKGPVRVLKKPFRRDQLMAMLQETMAEV